MEMMTTVILPWDSLLIMTAVNQVSHFKAFTFFLVREFGFVERMNL